MSHLGRNSELFTKWLIDFTFPQQCIRLIVALHPCQHLVLSGVLTLAILSFCYIHSGVSLWFRNALLFFSTLNIIWDASSDLSQYLGWSAAYYTPFSRNKWSHSLYLFQSRAFFIEEILYSKYCCYELQHRELSL